MNKEVFEVGDLVKEGVWGMLSIVIIGEDLHNYPLMEECYTGKRWVASDFRRITIISKAKK